MPRHESVSQRSRVLFLSTGNAARSPIAESVLQSVARGAVITASAGVVPAREIHPMAHIAVRNVFNGRITQERPKAVDDVGDLLFDSVITLSQEAADHSCAFPNDPRRVHWTLEDPAAAQGTRAQRQQAFDRVTRDILKRLRRWWRCRDLTAPSAPPPRGQERRPLEHAHWRTRPSGDAPILAVAYSGPPRTCVNMCSLLERFGFQVVCGERYARSSDALPVVPDALVVRVDGGSTSVDEPRPEFLAVQSLRLAIPDTPILILVDRTPSDREQQLLRDCAVSFVDRRQERGTRFVHAIATLVGHRAGVVVIASLELLLDVFEFAASVA